MSKIYKIKSLKIWIHPWLWVTLPIDDFRNGQVSLIGWERSCGSDVFSGYLSPHPLYPALLGIVVFKDLPFFFFYNMVPRYQPTISPGAHPKKPHCSDTGGKTGCAGLTERWDVSFQPGHTVCAGSKGQFWLRWFLLCSLTLHMTLQYLPKWSSHYQWIDSINTY